MEKIYACLTGNWVCLNDDENCIIGDNKSPSSWWENGAPIYAPNSKPQKYEDTFYGLNYVRINYMGKNYRINPIFIQIVSE